MPYYTDSVAYWHAPKCGGTFLHHWFCATFHGARQAGLPHDPTWMAPGLNLASHRHVGTIRDPWSWYVSLWRHASDMRPAWVAAHSGGSADFAPWLHSVLRRGVDPPIGIWPTAPDYPPPDGAEGLWSWLVRYMYQDRSRASWIVRDLIAVDRMYEGIEAAFTARVDPVAWPPRNAARSRRQGEGQAPESCAPWHSASTVAAIQAADHGLITLFGFRPFVPAPVACYRLPG